MELQLSPQKFRSHGERVGSKYVACVLGTPGDSIIDLHRYSSPGTQGHGHNVSQRGSSLLELSLVLPLFLLIFMGTFDLGRALLDYMNLARVLHEGTKYAARLPELIRPIDGGTELHLVPAQIEVVRNRVRRVVLRLQADSDLFSQTLTISDSDALNFELVSTGSTSPPSIRLSLRATYRGFFSLFSELPLSVRSTTAYLYPTEDA